MFNNIIGVIVLIVYVWVYFNRKNEDVLKVFSFRYNSLFKSVLLPVILVFGFWIVMFGLFKINSASWGSLFAAFWEEVVYRGLFVGAFGWFLVDNYKWNSKWVYGTLLIVVSYVFGFLHSGRVFDVRMVLGLIFGFVYLFDSKNLLPAFVGHFLSNLILVFV